MADFHLKISDTLPVLEATVVDASANPINISTVSSILFRMRLTTTDPFTDIVSTLIDDGTVALRGRFDVPWSATAGSTDVAGLYKAVAKLVFPGPLTMSVPNKGCKTVLIEDDC